MIAKDEQKLADLVAAIRNLDTEERDEVAEKVWRIQQRSLPPVQGPRVRAGPSVQYDLGLPPTVNKMYRRVGSQVRLTKKATAFRINVVADIWEIHGTIPDTITGGVVVDIAVFFPNTNEQDIDNRVKPLLDALEAAKVFKNDSQVNQVRVYRAGIRKPGGVTVTVIPYDGDLPYEY